MIVNSIATSVRGLHVSFFDKQILIIPYSEESFFADCLIKLSRFILKVAIRRNLLLVDNLYIYGLKPINISTIVNLGFLQFRVFSFIETNSRRVSGYHVLL
jgi:hypothetical protein